MGDEMKIREIHALMRLIDEPDSAVYLEISSRIHSFGSSIIPFLENEWEQTTDPFVQDRIESLIHQIQLQSIQQDLEGWLRDGGRSLLQAALIMARYQYPQLNEADVEAEISQIRKDIWLELNDNLTALEQIKVFNHVFYDIHGFSGNTRDYHDPVNSYLNRVLETRKGNPLSLGIVYMIIAQSLDLPVFGVNLPEHFVLAYTGTEFNAEELSDPTTSVLFYINAFSRGTVFNQQEVDNFLQHLGHEPNPLFFKPCRNEDIILRMLNNLINAYSRKDQPQKARDMESLRDLFSQQGLP
jgi:regulator of sirC expression with transglutaminase-like and TPR domain